MEAMALTESTYYILLSLYHPQHGYGIMQQTEQLSGGRVHLAAGTLYGALNSLCEKGWIRQLPVERGSRKKEYQLTTEGLAVLKHELARLQQLVALSMMNKLQQYFPMIRTKEEVLREIENNSKLKEIYENWQEDEREEFLAFVTGTKGVKMMYDFISKAILNPEIYEERVEEFLSLLLQHRRVRKKNKQEGKKTKSCYRDIKDVYTIVLFETSPSQLHKFRDVYLHHFEQKSDTGAEMNLLQKYLFVTLDNFRSIKHNKSSKMIINNRLEAWLAFMCMDEPDDILSIIEKYSDFKEMYEQAYDVCRNIEEVMQMFSKELLELDRNTVKLMIDDMQKEIDCQREQLSQKDEEMLEMRKEIQRLQQLLDKK